MNKQTIITILLALVTMVGQAQTFTPVVEDSIDFVITGTTTSSHDSVAMFLCAPHGKIEKFPIVGGKFKVTGRQPRHTFIQIGDNAENDLRFIVDETPTSINLVTGEVSGSELQQRFVHCQMRERDIDRVVEPWWDSLGDEEKDRIIDMRGGRLSDATAKDSANFLKYEDFMGDRDALVRQIIRENKDNVIPAYYLYVHHSNLNYEQKREFMREDAPYAHHPAMERPWKAYWGMILQMNITGKTAPDFEAEAPDGTMHRLSEYTGHSQYVLIDFWASWCGPCKAAIPKIKKFYTANRSRLTVVSVSVDEKKDNWTKAVKQEAMPWTQLWLTGKNMEEAASAYVINSIPRLVLIAPDGKIVKVTFDPEVIFKTIMEK